jgi:hypothetical protein
MQRLVKWGFLITFGFIATLNLVTILFFNVQDFTIIPRANGDVFVSILLLVSMAFAFLLSFRLGQARRDRKNPIAEILLSFIIMNGFAAGVQAIIGVIEFQNLHFDNLWTGTSYYFLSAATFFLFYFILEIFKSGIASSSNARALAILGVLMIVFSGYIVKDLLFDSTSEETIGFGLLMVVAVMFVYISLARFAFRHSRKSQDLQAKRGFNLIGASGICFVIGFLFIFVFNAIGSSPNDPVFAVINWVANSAILVGMFLIYTGFTLPMRNPNKV